MTRYRYFQRGRRRMRLSIHQIESKRHFRLVVLYPRLKRKRR